MSKLWSKGDGLNPLLEEFTVGNDYILDARLIPADIMGSLAHVIMLESITLLTSSEARALRKGLRYVLKENEENRFDIKASDEDGHTALENRLVRLVGDPGNRIHLGRSRNDQALTAMRIWMRSAIFHLVETGTRIVADLLDFAEKNKGIPMPGRTHMQPAMPSTVGLWAGGFAEQLLDDVRGIAVSYSYFNQCPLGTGAGYGVPLPLNREMTASLLGFARVQNNAAYSGLCRGKFESRLIDGTEQIALTLSKLAADIILFSMPEFGWFTLPPDLCTGSSIMPQKRNPDGLEIMRAKAASIGAWSTQVKNIVRSLPSGYNRDYQETKGPTLSSVDTVLDMLEVSGLTMRNLQVNSSRLLESFDRSIFATDAAIALAAKGMSFREAYLEVGTHPEKFAGKNPTAAIAERTSTGTPGNLRLDIARSGMEEIAAEMNKRRRVVDSSLNKLAGCPISIFSGS